MSPESQHISNTKLKEPPTPPKKQQNNRNGARINTAFRKVIVVQAECRLDSFMLVSKVQLSVD